MVNIDTMPANPSKTTQLKPMFIFTAFFEDVVADVLLDVLLPVLLPVLDGDVELLESATGKGLV
jgi:hypothetical protein